MPWSRRSFRVMAGACLVVLAACGDGASPVGPDLPAPTTGARTNGVATSERRHVLILQEGVNADLTAVIERAGGKVRRFHRDIGVVSITGLTDAAVAELRRQAQVRSVSSDIQTRWIPPARGQFQGLVRGGREVSSRSEQSGAFFFDLWQWNMRVIKADQAWAARGNGRGAGTLVCVLDSGIDPNHVDLFGKVNADVSASFVTNETALTNFDGHGSFVAAIISSNGIGTASVAPDAELCSVKVLDGSGSGSFDGLISGIVHTALIGANVANMSLGAYFSRRDEGAMELIHALQRALDFASRKGVLLVASAGNDGLDLNGDPKDFIHVPAELNHVISVGATAPVNQVDFDRIASYSNFGRQGVDVFAPGGDFVDGSVDQDLIFSPCSPSIVFFDCSSGLDYLIGGGTSFAAPHVSGEGAVIESAYPDDQGDAFLTRCILQSADQVTARNRDPLYNRGRINVLAGSTCAKGSAGENLVAELARKFAAN